MTADLATKRAAKPALVRVNGLFKQYVQQRTFSRRLVVDALRNVDLELQPECLTALVGASGSGKSTLASCLAMLEKPDAGEIWFEEREISRCDPRELAGLRPRIQMVFQDSAGALNPSFSAAQIVAEPLEVQRRESGRKQRQRACELAAAPRPRGELLCHMPSRSQILKWDMGVSILIRRCRPGERVWV
jgi:ABC-type glutathione transport system ATPase component